MGDDCGRDFYTVQCARIRNRSGRNRKKDVPFHERNYANFCLDEIFTFRTFCKFSIARRASVAAAAGGRDAEHAWVTANRPMTRLGPTCGPTGLQHAALPCAAEPVGHTCLKAVTASLGSLDHLKLLCDCVLVTVTLACRYLTPKKFSRPRPVLYREST